MRSRVPDDLGGTVVVVTGASSGIGRAAARAFADRGADVVVAARDEASLRKVAAECEEAGGTALVVPTDVSDEDAVQALAARTVDEYGRVDVWVNQRRRDDLRPIRGRPRPRPPAGAGHEPSSARSTVPAPSYPTSAGRDGGCSSTCRLCTRG